MKLRRKKGPKLPVWYCVGCGFAGQRHQRDECPKCGRKLRERRR